MLVVAWNKGGYCLTNKSFISQLPYLDDDCDPDDEGRCSPRYGSYTKVCSSPVNGSKTGAKKVSGEWCIEKLSVLT